jgi:hypothetical protein
MKSISFKNFENMLITSLDSKGPTVTIQTNTLVQLIRGFKEHPECSERKPIDDDPLYGAIAKLSPEAMQAL